MKMVDVAQVRAVRVTPSFSIKMQAYDKIRMQFEIHQSCAPSNFTVAVEQNFALPPNSVLFLRISLIKYLGAGLWHAIFNENRFGELTKIIRPPAGRRFIGTSDTRNFRAQLPQSQRQQS